MSFWTHGGPDRSASLSTFGQPSGRAPRAGWRLRRSAVIGTAVLKRIGEAFYGRAAAYDTGLDGDDDAALAEALLRNVLAGDGSQPERARRLAGYMRAADKQLAREEDRNLAQGRISFPDPEKF